MERVRQRAAYYLVLFVAMLAAYTMIYRWGMATFEGEVPSMARSLRFVVETITTVGYGTEANWSSDAMNLMATGMILTGVLFFFLSLPLFVIPLFEVALSRSPPTNVDLADHVVICGFTGRGETFIEELSARDTDYAVVESDRERAMDLHDDGYVVIHGSPESPDGLDAASVSDSRAVVADADDETNASIALTCREVAPSTTVVAFAEDPDNEEYIRYAGADEVLMPRHILGESLADKVTAAMSTELGDVVELDGDFEVAELPVQVGSEVEGLRLEESGIREGTGANIIGAWREGVFDPEPGPEDVLEAGTILLVAGRTEQLERLKSLTRSEARGHDRGRVLVVGHGEVGRTVSNALAEADVPYTVVDVEEYPSVDVVGDARDAQTLTDASVADARAVIFALPDDTVTIFATLVCHELADHVEVVARASEPDNVRKLYRAGADYVLSLSTVSGRMLASTVLEEEVMAPEKQVDVIRSKAPALAGQSLESVDVRSRTGTTVIAVERNGELLTDLAPEFVVQFDDELIVAGSDAGTNRFTKIAHH